MIGHEQLVEGIPGAVDHVLHWFGELSWYKLVFFVVSILVGIYLWRKRS